MKVAIIFLFICLLVVVSVNEARRGGGARVRFSSSRYSRYSTRYSRYRYSRYRYSRYRIYRARSWNVRMKKVAILAGTIYIARKMRLRLGYGRYHGNYNFEICRNFRRYPTFSGGTNRTGTQSVYGWFICPTDNVPMDNIYCCGPDGLQYCCGYWGNPGKVAGLVIGLLIAVGVMGAIVYFCCCKNRNRAPPPPMVQYKRPAEQDIVPPQPVPAAIPSQPPYGAAQPYSPPPSYDAAAAAQYPAGGAMPYPTGGAMSYPTGGAVPYPTGPPPPAPGYGGAPPPPGFYPPAGEPGYPTEKPPYPS